MVHYVEGFASEGPYQFFSILNPVALYHTGLVVSFQIRFQLLAEIYHIYFHLNI
jgi:hypothetical protein